MATPNKPDTNLSLSLTDSSGRQRLETTLADYVAQLRRLPAFCGTEEQQQTLIHHVAKGHELLKLVTAERLKITREIDHQKQEWMELEKQLTAPLIAALQPIKDAVEHYNRELMRVREHQLAELATSVSSVAGEQTRWLTPEIASLPKPKGVQVKWTYEIVDVNQVPNGYWIVDESAIKADIAKGLREIPGVRIYEEVVTVFRS